MASRRTVYDYSPTTDMALFVEAAERQLLQLFKKIDREVHEWGTKDIRSVFPAIAAKSYETRTRDGKLDKEELHGAFQRAGIAVP
ncbi:Uu.00g051380.m01.CDS01 [Anthostomella pinea]|uniref:Uu.00g051380.m01.CDS01 n=1 Tax=Anthostomella pinea TaxID=933095 RepID=A0AAI8VM92_9PEZI|nr:Uu.00g051380.m01.CDS01 [Anthostomella pinea]